VREEGVTLCECDSDLGRSEHDGRRKKEEVVGIVRCRWWRRAGLLGNAVEGECI
jgi:uncharacterized protein YodC (DUF2158 family)